MELKIVSGKTEKLMSRKQAVKTPEYIKGRLPLKSVERKTMEMVVHSHSKCVVYQENSTL